MRQRLSLLVLAVTAMVVLAFVVPLGLTVRDQAEDRALSRGQQVAQAVASGLAVAASLSTDGTVTPTVAELVVITSGDARTTVFLPDSTTVGADAPANAAVAIAAGGRALTVRDGTGAAILVPVSTSAGSLVVHAAVEDLREGVGAAWLGLGILGAILIAAGVALADRLGRSLVGPVSRLAAAARRMAAGDLEARVNPEGPPEIADAGEAFNQLAERLDDLLAAERESVADLSHRLRTPLTALRLQAEMIDDTDASEAMIADVDRLGRQVDALITEARASSRGAGRRRSDLAAVSRLRVEFWSVLAEEQGRRVTMTIPAKPLLVALPEDDLAVLVDTLIDNVFTHTPAGTSYGITVEALDWGALLVVEDAGPGIAAGSDERGRSGAGSTGLGLDIVRRSAERSGGSLSLAASPSGGARVEVILGPVSAEPS